MIEATLGTNRNRRVFFEELQVSSLFAETYILRFVISIDDSLRMDVFERTGKLLAQRKLFDVSLMELDEALRPIDCLPTFDPLIECFS